VEKIRLLQIELYTLNKYHFYYFIHLVVFKGINLSVDYFKPKGLNAVLNEEIKVEVMMTSMHHNLSLFFKAAQLSH
jgi:hypothetical protein